MTRRLRTTATSKGRQLTLDPLRKADLSIEVRQVETSLPCGLRMAWAEGSTPGGKTFDVCAGAGVGGKWLIMDIDAGIEGHRSYLIDLNHIVKAILVYDEQVV